MLFQSKSPLFRFALRINVSLDSSKLLPVEIMSYQAPDGLTIPAYLTRPNKRTGPAPMVVLIPGGPIARDEWEFNAEVQWLPERGYIVFQLQFRGSSGFGRAFEAAGYRQWDVRCRMTLLPASHTWSSKASRIRRASVLSAQAMADMRRSGGGWQKRWHCTAAA